MQAPDGYLYGTASSGGTGGNGIIFKINTAGAMTIIHAIGNNYLEGVGPTSGVVLGKDGLLYGVTGSGGAANGGTAFKVSLSGAGYTKLADFSASSDPMGFIQASDGNFYGTTYNGGAAHGGQSYRMTPAGALTVLHDFVGNADGYFAQGKPMQAKDGFLYGTTLGGGNATTGGAGTVYRQSLN